MSAEKSKMVATYQAEKKKLKVSFPIQDMIFFLKIVVLATEKFFCLVFSSAFLLPLLCHRVQIFWESLLVLF